MFDYDTVLLISAIAGICVRRILRACLPTVVGSVWHTALVHIMVANVGCTMYSVYMICPMGVTYLSPSCPPPVSDWM